MLKPVRLLLLALCITALMWAAVVWRWRHTQRAIGTDDIVLFLAVLPLLVLAGALALRWAWRRADAVHEATAARAAAASAAAPTTALPPATEREPAMRMLAWGVAMAGADDAATALALLDDPPALRLDAELRDADGLGVFTRRAAIDGA